MNKGCLISVGVLLFLMSLGLGYYFISQNGSEEKEYELTKPFVTDVIKKTMATGSIKPRKEISVKPQVSGVVEKIFVEAGQSVTKGQQLAKIKLVPSLVSINGAQSNVDLAKLRFTNAQRELDRQKELASRELDIETSKVSYENAEIEEKRQKQLFEEGVISEQEYIKFSMDRNLKKAAYENTKISTGNSLKQLQAEVDIRNQELKAAINNLQLLESGAAQNSKQVSNIITSTVNGMLLDIPVEEGSSVIERNNFNEGSTIATIADMNSLVFEGTVDESDVGKLNVGMPLELTIGAIENKSFKADLEYIAPKGIIQEGTVKFEIRAAIQPDQDIFLRAGYSASANIILDRKDKVIAIKERDIIYSKDSTFVEIHKGDQEFDKKLVKLGLSDGINIQVISGVDSTQQIKVIKE